MIETIRRVGVLWVPLLAVGAGIAVFRLLPSIWAACTDTEWDANRAWGIAGYAPLTALTVLVFCWAAYAVLATRSSVWVSYCGQLSRGSTTPLA